MVKLLCQQALLSPVKGGSHAGKKITRTQSHGLSACGPPGIKSLIAAIISGIVQLEAKQTLSSLLSQRKREETQHQ